MKYIIYIYILIWIQTAAAQQQLTGSLKKELIENLNHKLIRNYIYADTADRMATYLLERSKVGAYDTITQPKALARQLTADVRKSMLTAISAYSIHQS